MFARLAGRPCRVTYSYTRIKKGNTMKNCISLMICFMVTAGALTSVMASQPVDRGPEIINLKMGVMELRFQHWKHQTSVKNDCFNCHKTKIGVIDGWSKETAHKVCIPCHDLESKGPVQCHECHNKESKPKQ
jgi:predicted CXXCH cytochrome family protein